MTVPVSADGWSTIPAGRQSQDAVAVEEALRLVGRRVERVGHALVGHDQRPARSEQRRIVDRTSTGLRMSWIASTIDGQVVAARRSAGSAASRACERDAVRHARVAGVPAASSIEGSSRSNPSTLRRRVRARDRDGGPARRRTRCPPRARPPGACAWTSGTCGRYSRGERADEPRPVEVALRLDRRPIALDGHAVAGPVGLDQLRQRAADGRERPAERRPSRRGSPGRPGPRRGPAEARSGARPALRGVVDLEDAAGGLLLQPLAGVARVDPRPRGELAGRQRPRVGERPVEAQPVPQVDGEHVHRGEGRLEEPFDERVANLHRCWSWHTPLCAADEPIMASGAAIMVGPCCRFAISAGGRRPSDPDGRLVRAARRRQGRPGRAQRRRQDDAAEGAGGRRPPRPGPSLRDGDLGYLPQDPGLRDMDPTLTARVPRPVGPRPGRGRRPAGEAAHWQLEEDPTDRNVAPLRPRRGAVPRTTAATRPTRRRAASPPAWGWAPTAWTARSTCCPAASAAASSWPASCSPAATCCCSTSRPTTSTSTPRRG